MNNIAMYTWVLVTGIITIRSVSLTVGTMNLPLWQDLIITYLAGFVLGYIGMNICHRIKETKG